jgi:hypothetical protein
MTSKISPDPARRLAQRQHPVHSAKGGKLNYKNLIRIRASKRPRRSLLSSKAGISPGCHLYPGVIMQAELLIPIIAIIFTFGAPVAIIAIIFTTKARNNAELQKTVRTAIEKGETLPPEFIDSLQRSVPRAKTPMNDVRAGLILIAVAGGIMIWNFMDHGYVGGHLSGLAAIPGLIGVALLILGIIGLNSRKS